ncbi:MAG: Ig-like domain-containing protein, partial [Eggerthellaceae bacterium]|nr:Ig-like domain-containing protein [Eggerthellaceae bacterium]
GGDFGSGGSISISGGTVEVTGSPQGVGIGTGTNNYQDSMISFSGGEVTVYSPNYPAIGGSVSFRGGTVTASSDNASALVGTVVALPSAYEWAASTNVDGSNAASGAYPTPGTTFVNDESFRYVMIHAVDPPHELAITGGTRNVDYTYDDYSLIIVKDGTYAITMDVAGSTAIKDTVTVQSGVTADITLDGVSINAGSKIDGCAFNMAGATVNLTLSGENTLTGGAERAGLEAPEGSTLVITSASTGSLDAIGTYDGAGIGGGEDAPGGDITIAGGTVVARSQASTALGGTLSALPAAYDWAASEDPTGNNAISGTYPGAAFTNSADFRYVKIIERMSPVLVTGVLLSDSAKSLEVGESFTLSATVNPSDATNKTVSWASSNEDIATVSSLGEVSAVGIGMATITVTTTDGGFTANCIVTVTAVPVAPQITTPILADGFYGFGYAQILAATGDDPVSWSLVSGDLPQGLTLDSTGVISGTPAEVGTFSITVKAENDVGEDTETLGFTIYKATLAPSVSFSGAEDKTYDATTSVAGTPAVSLIGAFGADTPTATATFAFADANVGSNKLVNVTSIALDEPWGNYYQLSTTAITGINSGLSILPAELNVSAAATLIKTYDGTLSAAPGPVAFAGLQGGQTLVAGTDYTVTAAFTGDTDAANAGNAKPYTYSVALLGTALASNYRLSGSTMSGADGIIWKAPKLPDVEEALWFQPGVASAGSYDLAAWLPSVLAPEDYGTVAYTVSTVTDTNGILTAPVVGTAGSPLAIGVNATATEGETASILITVSSTNYEDSTITLTVHILDRTPVNITASAQSTTYNGLPWTGLSNITSGDYNGVLDYSYEGVSGTTYAASSTAPTDAGTYELTISVPLDNTVYVGSQVVSFSILKQPVTVTAADLSIKQGESLPAPLVTYSGFLGTDNATNALAELPLAQLNVTDSSIAGQTLIDFASAGRLNNTNGANYQLAYVTGWLLIEPLSSACDVTGVLSPSGAKLAGTTITANVGNNVASQTVSVLVSAHAGWKLFSDASCTQEIAFQTMQLAVGANTAFIQVIAEDGTIQSYTLIVTRAASQGTGGTGAGTGGTGTGGTGTGTGTGGTGAGGTGTDAGTDVNALIVPSAAGDNMNPGASAETDLGANTGTGNSSNTNAGTGSNSTATPEKNIEANPAPTTDSSANAHPLSGTGLPVWGIILLIVIIVLLGSLLLFALLKRRKRAKDSR